MRILLLTSEFPPYAFGGLGRYSYEVSRELTRLADVDVVCVPSYVLGLRSAKEDDRFEEEIQADFGIPIRFMFDHDSRLPSSTSSSSKSGLEWKSQSALAQSLETAGNKPYDIIFVQDFYNADLAARLLLRNMGCKIVAVSHLPLYAGFTYFDKAASDETQQRLEALLFRYAERIVVPSQFAKRVILQIYNVRPARIMVNNLGVRVVSPDIALNTQDKAGKRRNADRGIRLLTVARLTEQKGIHYVVKIAKELEATRLKFSWTLVGTGPGEDRFINLANRLDIRSSIRHIRQIAWPDGLAEHYRHSDIYLSTSTYETFGLSVLEAMAYGCAPVAFRSGALDEVIDHGQTGFLAEPSDVAAICKHVVRLSKNAAELDRVRGMAESSAREFTWEQHSKKLMSLFREVLG